MRTKAQRKLDRTERQAITDMPLEFGFESTAEIQAAAGEGEKIPRFRTMVYDGGLLKLNGFRYPVIVDLKGARQSDSQMKAFLQHEPEAPVGHVDEAQITDHIELAGPLSVPGQNRDHVIKAAKDGFKWETSIEASIEEPKRSNIEFIPAGRNVAVNGRQFDGPVIVARKSVLTGFAFVGRGGGSNTSAVIAASATSKEFEMTTETQDPITQEPDIQAAIEKGIAAGLKGVEDQLKSDREAHKQEIAELKASLAKSQQKHSVDKLVTSYGLEGEVADTIRASAAKEEWDDTKIELECLRASRNRQDAHFEPIHQKEGGPSTQLVINAAIGQKVGGFDEDFIAKEYGEKVADEITASRWKNFGMKAAVFEILRASGRVPFGGELSDDDVGTALDICDGIKASGGMSTFSLPVALSDYANKELLRSFRAVEAKMRRIAKRVSNKNFQPRRMFRLSLTKGFEEIGADGQYASARLGETSFMAEVRERGLKLALTRRDMANDDASGFRDLLQQFSTEGAHTIEEALATTLLSSIGTGKFFDTAKGNYFSGAGTALEYDNLVIAEAAFDAFVEETDDGQTGRLRSVDPSLLLCGPTNHVVARQLYRSTNLAFIDSERQGEANVFNEMYMPVKSKYLGNGKVTNANGTQWMLTADPAITSPIVLVLLNGREEPQVTTHTRLPGQSGMQWDVTLDFGDALHDDKAAVLFQGAA